MAIPRAIYSIVNLHKLDSCINTYIYHPSDKSTVPKVDTTTKPTKSTPHSSKTMKLNFGLGVCLMVAIASAAPSEISTESQVEPQIHTEPRGFDLDPSEELMRSLIPRQDPRPLPVPPAIQDGQVFLGCWGQSLTVAGVVVANQIWNGAAQGMGPIPGTLIPTIVDTIDRELPAILAQMSAYGIVKYVFEVAPGEFIYFELKGLAENSVVQAWVDALASAPGRLGALYLSMTQALAKTVRDGMDSITYQLAGRVAAETVKITMRRTRGPPGRVPGS
jgi:hypothetical protein